MARDLELKLKMTADSSQLKRELSEASAAANRVGNTANAAGRKLDSLDSSAKSAASGFAELSVSAVAAAAAIGAVSAKWADATNDVIRYNAELNQLNQSLLVSRDALQTWGLVGQRAGIDIADTFKDVSEKLAEFAATGGGEAVDMFKRIGISPSQIRELIQLAPDQQLLKIADAIDNVKNASQGEKIFWLESLADDSSKLLPYLDNAAAKLREIDRIARASGAILDERQNKILSEAYDNLSNIKLALTGAKNAAGTVGAELINAFSGGVIESVSRLDDLIYQIADDVEMMGDAWHYALSQSRDATDQFDGEMRTLWDGLTNYLRIGFTYLPVWAQAAFTASHEYGAAFGSKFKALDYELGAVWQSLMATIVESAGGAFATVTDVTGDATAAIIGQLADAAEAMSAFSDGAAQTAVSLRAMQNTAANAGEQTQAAVAQSAQAWRDGATASANAAKLMTAQGQAAEANAQYALANAAAYQQQTEKQREITTAIRENAAAMEAKKDGLAATAGAQQSVYINEEEIKKALDTTTDATKKANEAATDRAKTLKELVESLEKQRIALQYGDTAAGYYEDRLNGMSDATARLNAQAKQYNTYLEASNKLTQEEKSRSKSVKDQYLAELDAAGLSSGAMDSIDAVKGKTDEAVRAAQQLQAAMDAASQATANVATAASWINIPSTTSAAYSGGAAKPLGKAESGSAQQVVAILQKLGESYQNAVAIAANLKKESNFNSGAVGDSGRAYGVAQWHPDRQANFAAAIGKDIRSSTLEEQLKFVVYELRKGTERGAGRHLDNADSVQSKAAAVSQYYERPADKLGEMRERAAIATQIEAATRGTARAESTVVVEQKQAVSAATQTAPQVAKIATATAATVAKQIEYSRKIDESKVSAGDLGGLLERKLNVEAGKLVDAAKDHTSQITQTAYAYRAAEVAAMDLGKTREAAILTEETLANFAEESLAIERERAAIGASRLDQYRASLDNKVLSDDQKTELVNQKQALIFDEIKQKNEAVRREAELTSEQYRQWQLINEDGVSPAMAAILQQQEKQTEQFKKQKELAKELSDGLSNALMSAAESGFESFKSLADWLKSTFNNMVLKPIVQAVSSSIIGSIMPSVANASGVGGGGTGSLLSAITGNSFGSSVASTASNIGGMFGGSGSAISGLFANAGNYSNMAYGASGLLGGFFGDKMFGSGGGTGGAIGSAIGMAVAGPIGAVAGTVLGGLAGSVFGGKWETKDQGLNLKYSGGDISGQQYTKKHKDGGWFSSDKNKTEYSALDSALQSQLDKSFDTVEKSIVSSSSVLKTLGINTSRAAVESIIDGFSVESGNLSLQGKSSEEQQKIITTWFNSASQAMYKAAYGDIADTVGVLKNTDEDYATAFTRVTSETKTVTAAATAMGLSFNVVADDVNSVAQRTAIMSDSLVQLFGGLDVFAQATDYYYQNFYSESERNQAAIDAANKQIADFNSEIGRSGASFIDTKEEFRQYIEGLDLTTEAGQRAYQAAMEYAGALVTVSSSLGTGKSSIAEFLAGRNASEAANMPKYDVGSDYIPSDHAAIIHKGEMIFTASQSGSLRDNVVAVMSTLAQAKTAPVSGGGESNSDLIMVIKELIAENKSIKSILAAILGDMNTNSDNETMTLAQMLAELKRQNTDLGFKARSGYA